MVAFAMMPAAAFATSKVVTTSETRYEKYDGSFKVANKWKYTYNSRAQETKAIYSSNYYTEEGEKTGSLKITTKTSYDSKRRVSKVIDIWSGNGTYKDVYSYDSKNRVKLVKHYFKKEGKTTYKADGKTEYTYSSSKDTEKTYDSDGTLTEKIVTTYNSSGKVKTIKTYDECELVDTVTNYYSSGKLTKTIDKMDGLTYTTWYNDKGLIKKVKYNGDDYYISKFTYDSYGRLKTESTEGVSNSDSDDGSFAYKLTYKYKGYYKKHTNPKKVLIYWNDDTKAYEKTEYEYKTITY